MWYSRAIVNIIRALYDKDEDQDGMLRRYHPAHSSFTSLTTQDENDTRRLVTAIPKSSKTPKILTMKLLTALLSRMISWNRSAIFS